MDRFGFGPARAGETMVYGAQRPGYNSTAVEVKRVEEWIAYMTTNGIRRVCCLLPAEQLAYYSVDLLGVYRQSFGGMNVCAVGVKDYNLCEPSRLNTIVLPFLGKSEEAKMPVVVHCSGGSGRTGHVLAAWLARRHRLSVEDALAAVFATGRNPYEAVHCGNATDAQLRQLLQG